MTVSKPIHVSADDWAITASELWKFNGQCHLVSNTDIPPSTVSKPQCSRTNTFPLTQKVRRPKRLWHCVLFSQMLWFGWDYFLFPSMLEYSIRATCQGPPSPCCCCWSPESEAGGFLVAATALHAPVFCGTESCMTPCFVLVAPEYTARWLVCGRWLIHMDWVKEHRETVGKTDVKSDHFSFHHYVSLLVERSQSLLAFAFFWSPFFRPSSLPPVSLRIIFPPDLHIIMNAFYHHFPNRRTHATILLGLIHIKQ